MGRAHALLPYALAAAAVVVASAIALGATIRVAPTGAGVGVTTEPSAAPRSAATVDARMSYWRSAQNGVLELWTSDLDGDHRSRIATAGRDSDVALTRWSPDGSAVGYTIAGTAIGIAWLDATTATLPMPAQLSAARWRIVSYEWSPDAKRIAATFRAGNGLSNESDVYVAEARASASWERTTTMGDVFAGRWIDAGRLFVETASGMIGTLEVATKAIRPITGMPATSPQVGRDGRVWFAGGRAIVSDVSTQPVASGWVWSATIDGDELRRETSAEQAQARLFGMLADGRAVTGVPGGVYFAGDALVPLAFVGAGTVRRVVVSDDGKRVIGITESRILQIDAGKMPRSLDLGALPPPAAAATLLSGLRDADVWVARKVVPLARSAAVVAGPKAKLAFALGRGLWQMDAEGVVRQIPSSTTSASGGIGEPIFFASPMRWSPSGDRLAFVVTSGSPARASLVIAGASGVKRWDLPGLSRGDLGWSDDGAKVGIQGSSGPGLDQWTTQMYEADTGRAAEAIPGRAIFVPGSTFVLGDGDPDPLQRIRVGQRIDLVTSAGRRPITDARRLAAAPLLDDLPDPQLPTFIAQASASSDGAYLAVWLYRARSGGQSTGALVVVRTADGEPVWKMKFAPQEPPGDLTWAPSGHLLGWTVSEPSVSGVRRGTAVVTDPVENRTVLRDAGRFGGWAPDGRWIYVARDEGLFASPLNGGAEIRVSSFGVSVAAARP